MTSSPSPFHHDEDSQPELARSALRARRIVLLGGVAVGVVIAGSVAFFLLRPTAADAVAEHREAAERRLAAYRAVLRATGELPALGADDLRDPGVPLVFVETGVGDVSNANADVVEIGWLHGLGSDHTPAESHIADVPLASLVDKLLRHDGAPADGYDDARDLLGRFLAVRWVLVVLTQRVGEPEVRDDWETDGPGGQLDLIRRAMAGQAHAGNRFTFEPGSLLGEAHLFDLESGEHLGGVRFVGQSPRSFHSAVVVEGPGMPSEREQMEDSLRYRMIESARTSLAEALRSRVGRVTLSW